MATKEIEEEYAKLRLFIGKLDYSYYILDQSDVEDPVYDQMRRRLIEIEAAHPELKELYGDNKSPTDLVGHAPANHFRRVKHTAPMLSLGNTFNAAEVLAWAMSVADVVGWVNIWGQVKVDGLAVELLYDHGRLKRAATRGDGSVGEDVTMNIYHVAFVPRVIPWKKGDPEEISVRGEVVVKKDVFDAINAKLAKDGEKTFVNCRNYAAGSLRQKDAAVTGTRELSFVAYDTDYNNADDPFGWGAAMNRLQDFGFEVAELCGLHSFESHDEKSVQTMLDHFKALRASFDEYEIDGIVFKVDLQRHRDELGSRNRSPRWATAYKFPASEGPTILHDVEWQVGRTGQITPVGATDPVFIHGTTISSPTLHGVDEVLRLDLHYGDTIVIKRAGDVIPKVIKALVALRPSTAKPIEIPTHCPCCKKELVRDKQPKKATTLTCVNEQCPGRLAMTFYYQGGRNVLDIRDFGVENAKSLVGYQSSISSTPFWDMFGWTEGQCAQFLDSERMGHKLYKELRKAETQPLERVIAALCIPEVGEGTAERLAVYFQNFDAFTKSSFEELEAIKDIGKVKAAAIITWFNESRNRLLCETVKTCIKTMIAPPPRVSAELEGKTVVVSGSKFGELTRKQVEAGYKSLGAKITSLPTKGTHLVVLGTKYAAHKLETAQELNLGILLFDANGLKEIVNVASPEQLHSPQGVSAGTDVSVVET
jgi:DNA ligase (NAD+)